MGSSFFGRPKMGGSSSSSSPTTSSSSSPAKRGKSKNSSDKPKQPQRGLGVAQLEKIRLHSEFNCNSFNTYPSYLPSNFNHQEDVMTQGRYPSSTPYGFHPNMMMNASNDQYEGTTLRYGDSQPHHITPTWNPSYGVLESQHIVEPNITSHFLHEDPRNKSLGSAIQNFETSDSSELDLELRLSL